MARDRGSGDGESFQPTRPVKKAEITAQQVRGNFICHCCDTASDPVGRHYIKLSTVSIVNPTPTRRDLYLCMDCANFVCDFVLDVL